jgi:signal transduction histidine kinase
VPESRDEVSRLGETLNAMLARLEAAIEHERGFVADASHELRTPLAILKTELELALKEGRSEDELRQAVRSASDETDRLSRLADDLLVLARSDRGTLPLRLKRVGARELLERVAARFGLEPGAVDAPDGLALRVDSVRVEQALGNLVSNAIEHGGGAVRLSARSTGDRVELHVEDDGPGLPAEFVPRAFERFTRADSARTAGGAGLGLAIVDAIARAHGGRACVGERTRGADVWISVPALIQGSSAPATTAA